METFQFFSHLWELEVVYLIWAIKIVLSIFGIFRQCVSKMVQNWNLCTIKQ